MPLRKIEMPEEANKYIEKLMKASDSKDFGHLVGKALGLYDSMIRETGLGAKLVLIYEDGTMKAVEVQ